MSTKYILWILFQYEQFSFDYYIHIRTVNMDSIIVIVAFVDIHKSNSIFFINKYFLT